MNKFFQNSRTTVLKPVNEKTTPFTSISRILNGIEDQDLELSAQSTNVQQVFALPDSNIGVAHFATIENRPHPPIKIDAPPLQANYPTAIQNNPSSQQKYIQSRPQTSIISSVSQILPRIVNPHITRPAALSGTSSFSFPQSSRTPQLPNVGHSKENVVVKILPASGFYLNDEKERKLYFDAVKNGLLNENGYVFVNDVQSATTSQQNLPFALPIEPRHTGTHSILAQDIPEVKPQLRLQQRPVQKQQLPSNRQRTTVPKQEPQDETESFFKGHTSYDAPLGSIGKLPRDSDSVSNLSVSPVVYNQSGIRRNSSPSITSRIDTGISNTSSISSSSSSSSSSVRSSSSSSNSSSNNRQISTSRTVPISSNKTVPSATSSGYYYHHPRQSFTF